MATAALRERPRLGRPRSARAPEPAAPPLDLDAIADGWQRALDAADRALTAAGPVLPAAELAQRRQELSHEREATALLLASVARAGRRHEVPWLSRVPVSPQMLGLAPNVKACLFDLDGVLTDSGTLHALAWAHVLDDLLLRLGGRTGRYFVPFDRDRDYRDYFDGRPRLEGVHAFLAGRGIRLPEGRLDDPADADTAYGLARHKSEALEHGLRRRGVTPLPGSRRYLEAAGRAGLGRAVVSASASTPAMLELAGLATLVEERVDAATMRAESLRSRPAPDQLLAACHHLGVRPEDTVTFTGSPAGIAAGHAAGIAVVGVGDGARAELLRGFGAERVVPSLGALLDPQLAAAR